MSERDKLQVNINSTDMQKKPFLLNLMLFLVKNVTEQRMQHLSQYSTTENLKCFLLNEYGSLTNFTLA